MFNNEDVDEKREGSENSTFSEKQMIRKAMDHMLDDFRRIMHDRSLGILRTGCEEFDVELEHIGPGDLVMILGTPNSGKSGLAGGVFMKSVVQGEIGGAFFSSEYSNQQQIRNLVCAGAEYSPSSRKAATKNNLSMLKDSMHDVSKSNIAVRESYGLTVPRLRHLLSELKDTLNIHVVVIDGLDYLRAISDVSSPCAACGDEVLLILQELKGIAKTLDILVLFTVNDFGEYSANPRLKHAINQVVDTVLEVNEQREVALHGYDRLHAEYYDLPAEASTHLIRMSKNKTGVNVDCYCSINSNELYNLRFPRGQCVFNPRSASTTAYL